MRFYRKQQSAENGLSFDYECTIFDTVGQEPNSNEGVNEGVMKGNLLFSRR
jgi:hypothetical protein